MVDLSSLNERQLEAAIWRDGPLLVLAGPGSGKTKVLSSRIARIIEESPDGHFRVLGLTFTNKAAAEMRQRIEALVPGVANRVLLTTFHSFAGDIVRQHGHLVGLRPDFTIMTQDSERIALLDEAIIRADYESNGHNYTGERLLPLINRILENDVSSSAVSTLIEAISPEQQQPIKSIYNSYRERMIAHNSLDFGGLIAEALHILGDRPSVRKQIQRIYKYICVDEFQDTNLSQYHLLKHIVDSDTKNIFVVADDDQIIYQWNGASPERLEKIRQEFEMKLVQLPANYRCPPDVIQIANRLISHNTTRSADKQALEARKASTAQSSIRVLAFATFDDEAQWIASDILSRPSAEQVRCVVLARTRKLLEGAIEHLTKKGVPSYLAMRKDEFVSAPLRLLHAALRLANNPQDKEQIRRMCKAFYALEGLQIAANDVSSTAETFEGSALKAFASLALSRPELEQKTRSYLVTALPFLTDRLDFRNFCEETFRWLDGIQASLADNGEHFSEYADERATWDELVKDITAQFGTENVTLNVLLQELDMRSKSPIPPKGAVPCFTIHASKGMEFGHVYLIGMVEDQLPSWAAVKKGPNSREVQEERRNCFVAITRTEDSLTLTYAQRVFNWSKEPSRFLREMQLIA